MAPKTPLQFKEIREEKKALIMDVALEQFANVGFHATTIDQIARHAGISKGLIYNYFRSKDDLLGEIINRSVYEIYLSFDTNHDGYLTEDEFEHFLRRAFGILKEKRQFWRLLFGIMLQKGVYENLLNEGMSRVTPGGVTFREFSEKMTMQLIDYFKRKYEGKADGKDPMAEMLMFINTVKGFAITLLFANDMYQDDLYEKTIDSLVKMYR